MKYFLVILTLVLFGAPVYAQDVKGDEPSKTNLELAQKMHEIWPIRTRMESALDVVAQNFPPERQSEILATLRKSIQYDELEEESIKAMAEIFTPEELQAMIDFYGSENGRSISVKTGDYEAAIRPVLSRMMDKAMMDLKLGAEQ